METSWALTSMRPLRFYRLTFTNVQQPSLPARVYIRPGRTPCQAKQAGFYALEVELKADPAALKSGWRLLKQEDANHLIGGMPV